MFQDACGSNYLLAPTGEPAEGGGTVMNGILNLVLLIGGVAVILGLVGWGILLSSKKQEDQAKFLYKTAGSIVTIGLCGWFIRYEAHNLTEGITFDNFGTALLMMGAIVGGGVILSILWTPQLSEWVARPLSGLFDGGNTPPERKPLYSIAMAKRNRGHSGDAAEEVRRQLASFPNDFEGVMLLARIEAEDLGDLAAAEETLNHFCDWPGAPSKQVAAAYTQLADWQMRQGENAGAARAALQKIIDKYPDTDSALHAEQRIAHLSDAEQMILKRNSPKSLELPQGVDNVGLLDSTEFLKPQEAEAGRVATAYVKHLQTHPHDTEVREKLALIYARDYKRLDMATMELDQLINEPLHKPKQIAHWLNLLANVQVELGADVATVRGTLEKIIERFPDLPMSDLAQRRIARLENEFKGIRESTSVKMGTYEQNIGLKYGRPQRPPS